MPQLVPRLVIAGTHSGVGKTTVATGLMAALRARGLRVGGAKVGPDFIDPGYHALATGRPSRNLDPWMCGLDALAPLAGRAGDGCDVLVIEGVMGLFDGAADGSASSTADVAVALDAPVVLVVDTSSASASVAAVVHGFATFDPRVRLAGVVLNQVASDSHEAMVRQAIEPLGIPVLGVLRRDPALTWRDRHLGLIPVIERQAEVSASLDRLGAIISRTCDLDAITAIARSAPATDTVAPLVPGRVVIAPMAPASDLVAPSVPGRAVVAPMAPASETVAPLLPDEVAAVRIAVAAGRAFSFSYPDNLEALRAAGAELVEFDPCTADRLPDGCAGLVAGGGFPEVHLDALADNTALLADVRRRVDDGLVVWAECGGLLWLGRTLDGRAMAGVVDVDAAMSDRLTLGYRQATTLVDTPVGPAGTALRGHEYHYSTVEPAGDALALTGRTGASVAGFGGPRLLASYLHLHLGARPDLAANFVRRCHESTTKPVGALRAPYEQ